MISKSHPLANFLKVTGNIYATTLQRVKEDSQARSKEDPTFSGITPEESKTLEMKSERLKEILLDSKKKLNLQES